MSYSRGNISPPNDSSLSIAPAIALAVAPTIGIVLLAIIVSAGNKETRIPLSDFHLAASDVKLLGKCGPMSILEDHSLLKMKHRGRPWFPSLAYSGSVGQF